MIWKWRDSFSCEASWEGHFVVDNRIFVLAMYVRFSCILLECDTVNARWYIQYLRKKCCSSTWLNLIHKRQTYSVKTMSSQPIFQASHSAIISIILATEFYFSASLVFGRTLFLQCAHREGTSLVQLYAPSSAVASQLAFRTTSSIFKCLSHLTF
jgi:hypothetical protein